jgi:uncharacterized membrane protein YedE/YeeE
MKILKFLLLGTIFGFILIKAEVVSWFRIFEMFHFQAFHMYGVIGSAIAVGLPSVLLIKKFKTKSMTGEPINIETKEFHWGNAIGGFIFGLGWAMTGACPGPIYALIGSGVWVFIVVLISAIAGTYFYGLLRNKLPH